MPHPLRPLLLAAALALPGLARAQAPIPNPTPNESARFGAAVDVDGDVAVVGAPSDRVSGVWTGGAYVYRLGRDGAWALEATLRPAGFNPLSETQFGAHVAVSGDVVAVAAPAEWVEGRSGDAATRGVVYVFRRGADGAWALEAELAQAPFGRLRYGAAVDLAGDALVVGAVDGFFGPPGQGGGGQARTAPLPSGLCQYDGVYEPARVEVLRYDGGAWVRADSLEAPDGRIGTAFGAAVSLDGGVLAVGAPYWYTSRICDEPEAPALGRAYVFRRSGGAWAAEATLAPDGLEEDDAFGAAVAVSGDRVVVGAPLFDGAASGSGAAFSYAYDGAAWALEGEFVGEGTVELDLFGSALDLEGDYVVVGAPWVRVDGVLGATYGFRRVGGGWEQGFRVTVDVGAEPLPGASFPLGLGSAVALDGSHVVVGAPHFADYGADGQFGADAVRDIGRAFSYTREGHLRLSGLVTAGEGGPVGGDVAFGAVRPNPSSGPVAVTFALAAPAAVEVDVVDVLGRRVAVLTSGSYGPGEHTVASDVRSLPAGVYAVRLRSEGTVRTARITVVR